MYELKRAKKIEELIKLGDKELKVSLSFESIARDFIVRYNTVVKAENEVEAYKNNTEDIDKLSEAMNAYEVAILNLLQLIFGVENTKEILNYYEENYIEMVYEVMPFLTEVIVPKLKQYMEEERKNLSKKYKGKISGSK